MLLAAALGAADKDFNGRWNIAPENDPRGRVWWLEVTGAGSKNPAGRFVGAPGGDTDVIQELTIERGELRFAFERNYRFGMPPEWARKRKGVYSARLVDGKLKGTLRLDGQPVQQWTGERAPEIRDREDGRWKEGKTQALFNGKDLSGWIGQVANQDLGWEVKDGILVNRPHTNNLVSQEKFWNFVLRAEYRLSTKSNSGIGLRGRYEIQILDDHGKEQDTHSHGALYSRIKPAVNASKPAGEWQQMEVRLVGRTVTVKLNGQTVVDCGLVDGLTAMAGDADEAAPGPFILQGDHEKVEFRSLTVTPLVRQ